MSKTTQEQVAQRINSAARDALGVFIATVVADAFRPDSEDVKGAIRRIKADVECAIRRLDSVQVALANEFVTDDDDEE